MKNTYSLKKKIIYVGLALILVIFLLPDIWDIYKSSITNDLESGSWEVWLSSWTIVDNTNSGNNIKTIVQEELIDTWSIINNDITEIENTQTWIEIQTQTWTLTWELLNSDIGELENTYTGTQTVTWELIDNDINTWSLSTGTSSANYQQTWETWSVLWNITWSVIENETWSLIGSSSWDLISNTDQINSSSKREWFELETFKDIKESSWSLIDIISTWSELSWNSNEIVQGTWAILDIGTWSLVEDLTQTWNLTQTWEWLSVNNDYQMSDTWSQLSGSIIESDVEDLVSWKYQDNQILKVNSRTWSWTEELSKKVDLLVEHYNKNQDDINSEVDFNNDGKIDFLDFTIFMLNYKSK